MSYRHPRLKSSEVILAIAGAAIWVGFALYVVASVWVVIQSYSQ